MHSHNRFYRSITRLFSTSLVLVMLVSQAAGVAAAAPAAPRPGVAIQGPVHLLAAPSAPVGASPAPVSAAPLPAGAGSAAIGDGLQADPAGAPQAPSAAVVISSPPLVDSLVNDVDGDSRADPGDTLGYSLTVENTGDTTASNVALSLPLDANTSLVAGSLKATPMAVNDAFAALGNTTLTIGTASGVLSNDIDPNDTGSNPPFNDGLLVQNTGSQATTGGGTINLAADGSFTYSPPRGLSNNTDSFTYTVVDPDGQTDTGTVTFNIGNIIWYINNTAPAGGDGRQATPYNSLTAFTAANNGTGSNPEAGDIVFVYSGSGDYTGGITLLNNQKLIGQGVDLATKAGLTVPPGASLPGAGTRPVIANASGHGVTLGQGNLVSGLNVGNTPTGAGLYAASGAGSLTVDNAALVASTPTRTGAALRISGGSTTLNVTLDSIQAYSAAGNAIDIQNASGTFIVNGNTTINDATGRGVNLASNTAAFTFTGLDISDGVTGSETSLYANGGTLTVSGADNVIATTNSRALDLNNLAIGGGGITFLSVSVSGGGALDKGIVLNSVSGGAFSITGSGASDASGGTLQNITNRGIELSSVSSAVSLKNMALNNTGSTRSTSNCSFNADSTFVNSGCAAAVHLSSVTGNPTLDNVDVTTSAQTGVNALSVANFTYRNGTITGIGDATNGGNGLNLRDLSGSNLIQSATLQNAYWRNAFVFNLTGSLQVLSSTFNGSALASTHNLFVYLPTTYAGGGSLQAGLAGQGNTFTGSNSGGTRGLYVLDASTNAGSSFAANVENNIFTNNNEGLVLEVNAGTTGDLNFKVATNTLSGRSTQISLAHRGATGARMEGHVTANTITANSDDTNTAAFGVFGFADGLGGEVVARFLNNNVLKYGVNGVAFSLRAQGNPSTGSTSAFYATMQGNTTVSYNGTSGSNAVGLRARAGATGNTNQFCLNLPDVSPTNNIQGGEAASGGYDYTVAFTAGNTFNIAGLSGGVAAFIGGRDIGGANVLVGSGTFGSTSCQTPTYGASAPSSMQVGSDPAPAGGKASFAPLASAADTSTETQTLRVSKPENEVRPAPLAADTVTLNGFSIPAGEKTVITFQATIVKPFPGGLGQVCAQGTVSGGNFANAQSNDPDTGAPSDATCTTVYAAPDLSITKTDGGVTAQPGDTFVYTLGFANALAADQVAANVVITETVPANTTFNAGASSAGWSCTPNNNAGSTCTLSIGSVNVGASGNRIFAVTVVNPAPAGVTQVSNTASVGSNRADANAADNTASDTTPLDAAPDLSLTKSDGGASVIPGGTVAYTLSYANNGNQGATGVALNETVPANTTFNAGASTTGWSCVPNNNAGSTCTLTIGALNGGGANGSATFAVTTVSPAPAGVDQISNTAVAAAAGGNGADPTPGNNSASDTTPLNAAPDLSITKSDNPAIVDPGGVVVYTLSYANGGNQNATGVAISETVPANTTFNAGASSAGWSCVPNNNAGSLCTLAIGALNAGANGSRDFAVTVATSIPGGTTQVSNVAEIYDDGGNGADPTPADNRATDDTSINVKPDLQLTKSDGGVSAQPGGTIAYTLNYANSASATQEAASVVITETVPANTTFNAGASTAGWSCANGSPAGTTCTFTVGTLAIGASGSATFAVTVVNPLAAGVTQVSNTAAIGSLGADANAADNTASDTTPLDAAPDLSLTKSDGGASVIPGGTVAYTLSYANNGNQGATGVALNETVPANTTFNAGASTTGWSCVPNNNAGSTCTLTIGALNGGGANGSATFAVTTVSPAPAGVDQISNTAVAAAAGGNGADPTPGNNSASDTTPLNAAPDLSITKSDNPAIVDPGGVVVYTLSYANGGNQNATGVAISETVPANTTFNAGASSAGWSCVPNNNAGSLCTLAIGALNAGANGSRDFAVTVATSIPGGTTQVSNAAEIYDDGGNGADPTPADNRATDSTPINVKVDLQLTKSDGGVSAQPGGTIAYTLGYTNNTATASQDAASVVITETVPANTAFNAGASSPGWSCTPDNNAGSTCTIHIGSLAIGASGSQTFAVTVVNPLAAGVTQASNTAAIGSSGVDFNLADNTASDTTPLNAAPDLSLSKDDGRTSIKPGETAAYTLSYANNGDQGATGVALSETVPANTTFNPGASTAGWSCAPDNNAGSACTLTIGALNGGGASGSATFAVTVVKPAPAGVTQISNTANVADDGGNGADPTPGNNSDGDVDALNAAPDLALAKDDGGVTANPNGTVVYTLVFTNTGDRTATGLVITETVPAYASFNAGASSPGWNCTPNGSAGSTCTNTYASLAGDGGHATLLFAVSAAASFPAGVGELSNTARIGDDGNNGADPNPADNTASDVTPLNVAPDLQLTKSDGGVTAQPGGTIAYVINYTNSASASQGAAGVVLTETVPANTAFNAGASSAGWSCTPDGSAGSVCTLSVGALDIGASGSKTFAVTVANPLSAGVSQVSNTASAGSNRPDANSADNTASDTTPVDAAPDLKLSKDDGGIGAGEGNTVAYALTFTNTGNQGASGVTLNETVPDHTTFNPGASTAGWNCLPDNNAGSACTLNVGPLNGGGSTGIATFAVTVDNPVTPPVQFLSNTATIADDGSNGADPNPADNTASDTTPLSLPTDLVVVKSAPFNPVIAGTLLTYTVTVSNTGQFDAYNVQVVDTLPGQVRFAWASPGCAEAGGVVTCDLGNLAFGNQTSLQIRVTVPVTASNKITNLASVTSIPGETDPSDNQYSLELDVTPSQVFYQQDFEGVVGSEWCHNKVETTPLGARKFLGQFGNDTTCLTLTNLPPHGMAEVGLDLYIIRSWNGNMEPEQSASPASAAMWLEALRNPFFAAVESDPSIGPDRWQTLADGASRLLTSFSNWVFARQSYPGVYPSGDYPARSGAVENNTLGYISQDVPMDAVYHIDLPIVHNGSTLYLEFEGLGLQALADESWGLDNVTVTLKAGPEAAAFKLYLPAVLR